jgi:hypothetical protein
MKWQDRYPVALPGRRIERPGEWGAFPSGGQIGEPEKMV